MWKQVLGLAEGQASRGEVMGDKSKIEIIRIGLAAKFRTRHFVVIIKGVDSH